MATSNGFDGLDKSFVGVLVVGGSALGALRVGGLAGNLAGATEGGLAGGVEGGPLMFLSSTPPVSATFGIAFKIVAAFVETGSSEDDVEPAMGGSFEGFAVATAGARAGGPVLCGPGLPLGEPDPRGPAGAPRLGDDPRAAPLPEPLPAPPLPLARMLNL